MSLSKPNNQNPSNTGVKRSTSFGQLTTPDARTASPLNQIRGISANGSTGAGIPKHVSKVASQVSNGDQGTTCAVSVTYSRDPSDQSHAKVNVYVKGYQGNSSPVQVASGSESPVTFVLNNTGESVSVLVQSQGNSGAAPLATAPSTGVKLPAAVGGGYSTTTVTTGETPPPTPPPALTTGIMFGPGYLQVPPMVSTASINTGVANRVRVCKFSLAINTSFTKCSMRDTSGTSSHYSFGIYTLAGDKLFDSGVFTGTGSTGAQTKTFGVVSLEAGTYYAAQTSDNSSGNTATDCINIGSGQLSANAGSAVVLGKAANTSASGVLPATLGAISTDSDGTFAVPIWEA